MPLKSGKKNVSSNIKELMDTYKSSGKIGNVTPKNKKHAAKVAAAIAYKKAREK